MYRAAVRFADLQDGNRIYEAGEQYPRPGFNASEERIKELAGSNNLMGYPLIAQEATETPENAPESEPKQSTAEKPKAARKPRRKRESDAGTDM